MAKVIVFLFISRNQLVRTADSITSVAIYRSGSYFAPFYCTKCTWAFESPNTFDDIEIVAFKHRLIQRLLGSAIKDEDKQVIHSFVDDVI